MIHAAQRPVSRPLRLATDERRALQVKKHGTTLLLILAFAAGLSLLLYPSLSD